VKTISPIYQHYSSYVAETASLNWLLKNYESLYQELS